MLKAQVVERLVVTAHTAVFRSNLRQLLHIVATQNPGLAQTGQSFFKVNLYIGVAERTAGVVNVNVRIGSNDFFFSDKSRTGYLLYFAHSHAQFRIYVSRQVYLFRTGKFNSWFHSLFNNVFYSLRKAVRGELASATKLSACNPKPAS